MMTSFSHADAKNSNMEHIHALSLEEPTDLLVSFPNSI